MCIQHITQVKLIVMKGGGGKAFCAGGDVVGVRQAVLDGVSKPTCCERAQCGLLP